MILKKGVISVQHEFLNNHCISIQSFHKSIKHIFEKKNNKIDFGKFNNSTFIFILYNKYINLHAHFFHNCVLFNFDMIENSKRFLVVFIKLYILKSFVSNFKWNIWGLNFSKSPFTTDCNLYLKIRKKKAFQQMMF